jgi:methyl-accepting chemotaxis protein
MKRLNLETGRRQQAQPNYLQREVSMENPHKNRRKQIFIKGSFQQKLILNTMLMTLISLNVIIIAAHWLESIFGAGGLPFSVFNVSVAALEVIAFITIYFLARKISFHIAGPIYAVERTLGLMNKGDLTHNLRLRKGDQFVEAAEAINTVIENYRTRLRSAQELLGGDAAPSPEQLQQLKRELQWFVTSESEK